jgi:hypothetical protein
VVGGATSTGTVTLGAAAPAGGALITLASDNINAATVPASVTVVAGAITATFTVTSTVVTTATAATITATYNGVNKTATLTVNPPAPVLTGIALNPAAVVGGATSTGTVTLGAAAPAGGVLITLASNNINAATVPASVTVVAGATTATFTVTSKVVTTATAVDITATYNGVNKTAALTVNPAAAALTGIALNPTAVVGGATSTGTVTLGTAAPAGGALITLFSNNINAATVPASVTVVAGATTATFTVTSKVVTTATAANIRATYNGVNKIAALTVNPAGPATLQSLTLNPAVVIFGANSLGTVQLTAPAPAGGAVITLTTTDWVSFYLPASVTVPAGATSVQFFVSSTLSASTTTITATYNGVNKTANLTSVYPTVVALTCNPNPVISGTTTICTVTLNGLMVEPTPVFVLSDQPFFAPANGTVTVPVGANSAAFSINTTLVPDTIVANISANALATATVTTPLTLHLTNRGRKWVLNNVAFKGGGTANGYFVYDAVAGQYLAVNILVTPGNDQDSPLGKSPVNLYYYPWPNGFYPTILDDWSTASLLSLQNPAGVARPAWTLFQFNFAQALTNAGGTVPLVVDPVVAYSTYCMDKIPAICTPPPANISQEYFAMPPYPGYVTSAYYFRVMVSGSVTAQ